MIFARRLTSWALCLAVLAAACGCVAYAATSDGVVTPVEAAKRMSLERIQEELQACPIVQHLNAAPSDETHSHTTSSRLFSLLFPGSPATNALLATLYISGPPNLLLALCPADIDPSALSVMVAFAVGGLLGDTLFHLLPEIFLGGDDEGHGGGARFVLVEPNRNLLLGLAILVGFMVFVAMDKGLRIATGGGGGGGGEHGHSHSHALEPERREEGEDEAAETTGVDKTGGQARSRRGGGDRAGKEAVVVVSGKDATNPSVKLGGYLNLIADFTHNITDGLAMSASFYASPALGATTAVAVFFHEIPHEVGDFALLVQSGFSKRAAMASQFVTALGALLGTLIGIAVHELGGGSSAESMPRNAGIWGTSLTWGDLLLPFTAGTFLYVGTVAVIPDLLETPHALAGNRCRELRATVTQFVAVAVGAGIMLYISWHD